MVGGTYQSPSKLPPTVDHNDPYSVNLRSICFFFFGI